MAGGLDGRMQFLGFVERPVYRLLGTGPDHEQLEALRRIDDHLLGRHNVFTYFILRIQGITAASIRSTSAAVSPALSANTAPLSTTNTNWQNYGGETTMFVLLPDRRPHLFSSSSARRRHRRGHRMVRAFPDAKPHHRDFWVDIIRCMLYILAPIAFIAASSRGPGAVQTLAGTTKSTTR